MTIVVVVLLAIAALAAVWLSRQRLMSKPWLEVGELAAAPGPDREAEVKAAVVVFLAVVACLFALMGSAVVMRMGYADWYELSLPPAVWLNTALLLIGSVFLQIAVGAARRGEGRLLGASLAAGGLATLGFLAGQIAVWRMLIAGGQVPASSPGAGFFYLISGAHGLHILGGLAALGRVGARFLRGDDPRDLGPGVGLAAAYWHFLLIIWVGMLVLLLGWASDFVELCRSVLT
jgi:cytochrome c oxidase subunit III